ncbi:MAG TPA: YebC/PmpR family DNA-binding transcriptional regulator, partial [Candidatus Limnocylindria bacterium]|nr:YebC/PmpR family DNA-binding transcriptional regulator [Candidatus Limnocylindria bacterium]
MSGHSKWSQIKRTKGVLDQKRGMLFSKLGKKISIAAKEGGSGDPGKNFQLQRAVDYAKEQGMPNDNIERAIKAAAGGSAGSIKEVVYEGYGPYGTAFLVETATDNTNRTSNNIKHIFSKHGGNMGAQGSVAWQFSAKGQILVERDGNLPAIEMAAIDAGADDVRESAEGLEVYTKSLDLNKVKQALLAAGAKIAQADVIKESSQGTDLTEEQKPKVDALFAELENDE